MTRRKFVLGLSVSALALAVAIKPGDALAQRGPAISIDVRPLESLGGRNAHTVLLRQHLQKSMAKEFAGRSVPPMTVRIYRMILSASIVPGGASRGSPGTDYLEGEILVGGKVIPLLVTQDSNSAGYWRLSDFDQKRVEGLAEAFAGWAKRKV